MCEIFFCTFATVKEPVTGMKEILKALNRKVASLQNTVSEQGAEISRLNRLDSLHQKDMHAAKMKIAALEKENWKRFVLADITTEWMPQTAEYLMERISVPWLCTLSMFNAFPCSVLQRLFPTSFIVKLAKALLATYLRKLDRKQTMLMRKYANELRTLTWSVQTRQVLQ